MFLILILRPPQATEVLQVYTHSTVSFFFFFLAVFQFTGVFLISPLSPTIFLLYHLDKAPACQAPGWHKAMFHPTETRVMTFSPNLKCPPYGKAQTFQPVFPSFSFPSLSIQHRKNHQRGKKQPSSQITTFPAW